jgi:hypothetical protein
LAALAVQCAGPWTALPGHRCCWGTAGW